MPLEPRYPQRRWYEALDRMALEPLLGSTALSGRCLLEYIIGSQSEALLKQRIDHRARKQKQFHKYSSWRNLSSHLVFGFIQPQPKPHSPQAHSSPLGTRPAPRPHAPCTATTLCFTTPKDASLVDEGGGRVDEGWGCPTAARQPRPPYASQDALGPRVLKRSPPRRENQPGRSPQLHAP